MWGRTPRRTLKSGGSELTVKLEVRTTRRLGLLMGVRLLRETVESNKYALGTWQGIIAL